uniref:Uncharacterized protein n=1 Tax=Rhodnius prolixus TaxID=13249 RepID=T1HSB4_RHOPR
MSQTLMLAILIYKIFVQVEHHLT